MVAMMDPQQFHNIIQIRGSILVCQAGRESKQKVKKEGMAQAHETGGAGFSPMTRRTCARRPQLRYFMMDIAKK
jgi:hypothetical protein